jgi:hypothetical protein
VQPALRPGRDRSERLVATVLQPGAGDERIDGLHLDVACAGPVGRLGQGDDQLAVGGLGPDDERVARSDRDAGLDDRVGVPPETFRLEQRLPVRRRTVPL